MGIYESIEELSRKGSLGARKKFVKRSTGKSLVKEHPRKPKGSVKDRGSDGASRGL